MTALATESPRLEIRQASGAEGAYVRSSWKRSNRRAMLYIPDRAYYDVMERRISGLLGRGAEITVAAMGDFIVGWVCHEDRGGGVVHYTHVRKTLQRGGVARVLWRHAAPCDDFAVTHWSEDMAACADTMHRRDATVRFEPWLLGRL